MQGFYALWATPPRCRAAGRGATPSAPPQPETGRSSGHAHKCSVAANVAPVRSRWRMTPTRHVPYPLPDKVSPTPSQRLETLSRGTKTRGPMGGGIKHRDTHLGEPARSPPLAQVYVSLFLGRRCFCCGCGYQNQARPGVCAAPGRLRRHARGWCVAISGCGRRGVCGATAAAMDGVDAARADRPLGNWPRRCDAGPRRDRLAAGAIDERGADQARTRLRHAEWMSPNASVKLRDVAWRQVEEGSRPA